MTPGSAGTSKRTTPARTADTWTRGAPVKEAAHHLGVAGSLRAPPAVLCLPRETRSALPSERAPEARSRPPGAAGRPICGRPTQRHSSTLRQELLDRTGRVQAGASPLALRFARRLA